MNPPRHALVLPAAEPRPHVAADRVRVALVALLTAATPAGWEVTDAGSCTVGPTAVSLDIAVRPVVSSARPPADAPVLCVDVDDRVRSDGDRLQRRRLHTLAGLGVDHYWHLSTRSGTLDVYVRTGDEYRHAETTTGSDWIDFGVGLIQVDLPHLLETSCATLGAEVEGRGTVRAG